MPEALNKNLDKLDRLLTLMDTEGLTRKEFTDAFQQVIDLVSQIQEKQEQEIEALNQAVQNVLAQIANDSSTSHAELRSRVDKLFVGERIDKMEKEHSERMQESLDRMSQIRDGRDGLRGERGPQGVDGPPGPPGALDASAVKNLVKQYVKEIMGGIRFGGGANNYGRLGAPFEVSEAPSGSINGSNKIFYLSTNPISNSVDVYLNGVLQRPGASNEYTLAGKTITFANNNKPQTGSTLWVRYKKL